MEDRNKIIELLEIKFVKAKKINILKPVRIENNCEVENHLLLVTGGEIRFGKEQEVAKQGDVIFIPGGKFVSLSYGSGSPSILSKEDFLTNKDQFLTSFFNPSSNTGGEHYSYVAFDAKMFGSLNFFLSSDIPPFKIKNNDKIIHLIKEINDEMHGNLVGKNRIVKILTEQMTVELIRYLFDHSPYEEKIMANASYLKDARLVDIFAYIKEHLSGDLSNRVLADVTNVSEEYIGQYFKMLMGITPQDYIEYQRMEMAVKLLRTTEKSIQDIGKTVGYKDTAYFCRRFKMMFGIPAGKMRRIELL